METKILDKSALQELIETTSSPALTAYIPMHTTASPPHISENQIRFKSMMHDAAKKLRLQQGRATELAASLEGIVNEYHDDVSFWENQAPGLLICASPDHIRAFRLPVDTEEYLAVDDYFHLAPVIGLMQDAREFYVLELAQQNPRFYQGDLYGLKQLDANLPTSIKEALNIDEANQKSENQGTTTGPSTQGAASSPSQSRGWFNGRGGAKSPQESDRSRFWRLVDKAVNDYANHQLYLVLAGPEADIAEFREISRYPKTVQNPIFGNHSRDNPRQLFEAARHSIWQELVLPEHQAAAEEYLRIRGANPERVADKSKHIAEAATQGRVDKLLAKMSLRTADTVRDQNEAVLRITFPSPEESRKLNDIARSVWQASGRVYNLMPDEMPGETLMVARLRY